MNNNESRMRGDWMQTYTGKQFWPLDPKIEDIDIKDIAHALSLLCRYGGHCKKFYSVAEHSVLMSRAAKPKDKLWALLHDATEAYLVDMPRPIKKFLTNYVEFETRLMDVIADRFDLEGSSMPSNVKELDNAILVDERMQNMSSPPAEWAGTQVPLGIKLQYWTSEEAEAEFLKEFHSLYTS